MVFVIFMLGVGLRRQKLKPRPKSDLTLGIGLEVWQISWKVILLNLFWYSVMVISPINCCASYYVGLDGSTNNPYLLKRFSLNLESHSRACFSSSNFFLQDFLNSCWRIWCFCLCWILLYLLFCGGYLPFSFRFHFPLMSLVSMGFWCLEFWLS